MALKFIIVQVFHHLYIMYNLQDYSVHYNNAVLPAICEGWHITHKWKALAWPHHFIEVPVPSQESFWSCICVLGLSIYDFSVWFWNCVVFLFFVILELCGIFLFFMILELCGIFLFFMILELCGIFVFRDFGTVWYFFVFHDFGTVLFFVFRDFGIVVFLVFHDFRTVWYF